jgi:alpha-D-xyloside xylohydrolase
MAYHQDYTLMRSLAMSYTSDKQTYGIGDQFMFGPGLMVCPVYRYGARSREVYFPAGNQWYDFYSNQPYEGGKKGLVEAPLERIPVFVPAGAILPIGPVMQYASEKKADDLEIRVYKGKNGQFSLYEDDGTNYDYEKGAYATILFEYDDAQGTLTIGQRQGRYEGMVYDRTFRINCIGKTDSKTRVVTYNGTKTVVKL